MKPPNPQTDVDREYLRGLFYLFKDLPFDFEFPLVINENYVPPSNSLYCFIIGAVACCITIPTVFLRLWVRYKSGFGTDDWIIVPALISYCVFSAVNAVAVWGTGMGYHVYDLSRKDIHNFIVIKYIHVNFWFAILHFCRLSILHLLLRLTPSQLTLHRRYLLSIIWISWLYLVVCLVCHTFECGLPLSMSFELKSSLDGTCIGAVSLSMYGGLIVGHILLDIFTILPPLIILRALPMSSPKKFNLVLLLTLGVFTILCSLLRIFVFYRIMVSSYDITWNATDVAFWSMFECSLACIIACLPALNHLIIKFLKKVTKFLRLNESRGPKSPKGKLGAIRFPVCQAEAYQRSVISNGYGQYVKRWANNSSSRPGSEYSAADTPMRRGSRSGSTTASNSSTYPSTYSTTNNSSVMETTIYIIDEIPSDVEEEEQETFGNISTAGLGPGNTHESDPTEHSPSSSEKADASENV
ncbi:hypothetical protein TWF225_003406 [Orbilia oligospora]|nr:hypothetical protein TWF225_003406 [Orbilia oligospora]KAF3250047.1 hypothetical protein TWF128_007630 [Orbilia oligospora]KAF3263204.1 hypothetical protein TWF217_003645 [Orbilia oligospora]KAF3289055.1 hypothetical protein TWF132_007720 [Orbilia oligospora]